MLTSLKPLLKLAREKKFAYGAFNVNGVCQIEAAIRMHEIMRSPLILQGAELANGFMGGRIDFMNSTMEDKKLGMERMVAAVKKYGNDSDIPIVLHLDHGQTFESCKMAIDAGYTSVMIDGSKYPLDENIKLTKSVVDYAHNKGVSVEGELGVLAGVEDEVFSETSSYTHPLDALRFIRETGVDALAISYGTMHGANKGTNVKLRKEIAIAINEILSHEGIDTGLVSHGSSNVDKELVEEIINLGGELKNTGGIPISELQEVVKSGISKINVDTDIRLTVTRNLRRYYKDNNINSEIFKLMEDKKNNFDPRYYLAPVMDMMILDKVESSEEKLLRQLIMDAVMEVNAKLISAYGSFDKADLVDKMDLNRLKEMY